MLFTPYTTIKKYTPQNIFMKGVVPKRVEDYPKTESKWMSSYSSLLKYW